MARTLNKLPRTKANAWANYCRATRATTRAPRGRYRGHWPLTPKAFAEWLSGHLAAAGHATIGQWGYIHWEQATVVPPAATQALVRSICEQHLAEVTHSEEGITA